MSVSYTVGSMSDDLRRLRAIAAEWSDEVASDSTRAEVIEGRFGVGSPEHASALAALDESRARLAVAHEQLAAARRTA